MGGAEWNNLHLGATRRATMVTMPRSVVERGTLSFPEAA